MIDKSIRFFSSVIAMSLLIVAAGMAQDATDEATQTTPEARGTFAPAGGPLEPPVRIDAGASCIVDLRQPYAISGRLTGSMEIDFRIRVAGPCGSPPATFDEEWIAHGTFTGTVDRVSASGKLSYTADVKAGGAVEGHMVFGQGLDGELRVEGNLGDGKLFYTGRLQ